MRQNPRVKISPEHYCRNRGLRGKENAGGRSVLEPSTLDSLEKKHVRG